MAINFFIPIQNALETPDLIYFSQILEHYTQQCISNCARIKPLALFKYCSVVERGIEITNQEVCLNLDIFVIGALTVISIRVTFAVKLLPASQAFGGANQTWETNL